jgi:hypothetical protein
MFRKRALRERKRERERGESPFCFVTSEAATQRKCKTPPVSGVEK